VRLFKLELDVKTQRIPCPTQIIISPSYFLDKDYLATCISPNFKSIGIFRLGVVLTRKMDRWKNRRMDKVIPIYTHTTMLAGGIIPL